MFLKMIGEYRHLAKPVLAILLAITSQTIPKNILCLILKNFSEYESNTFSDFQNQKVQPIRNWCTNLPNPW